ncbi:hypothetical protein Q8A67_024288 [Cirrhinus molitorella]|uniref:Uncharacterized protein n=1 Tax=Cirrhinus molitorella TaxID=172907 RepID=A0AA88T9B9_9TELE|nr:hypothetical protein Q8A67_024288 [Cirrhinus molitorella]
MCRRKGSSSSHSLDRKVPFVKGAGECSPSHAAPQFGGYLPNSLSEKWQDITHSSGRKRLGAPGPGLNGFMNGSWVCILCFHKEIYKTGFYRPAFQACVSVYVRLPTCTE